MLTDIEIAQKARMLPIEEAAGKLGLERKDLELYGDYKAKIKDSVYDRLKDKPDGKLILVTAINPTPQEKENHNCRTWPVTVQNRKESNYCAKGSRPWAL